MKRTIWLITMLFFAAFTLYAQTIQTVVPDNFVLIEGGTFMMGSPQDEPESWNNADQHIETVDTFFMRKYQVTVEEFRRFVDASGYLTDAEKNRNGSVWINSELEMKPDANWKNPYFDQEDNHPVVLVSWNDAIQYCNWLSRQEGLTPAYTINEADVTWNQNAAGYRLPTEAEWEYACRAGTTTPFNTGNNINTSDANYNGNYPYKNNAKGTFREKTTAVCSFAPNSWGLYDMHANVWELCWDLYRTNTTVIVPDEFAEIINAFTRDVTEILYSTLAPTDTTRVVRGGSWDSAAECLRSAYRGYNASSDAENDLGFRVARNAQ